MVAVEKIWILGRRWKEQEQADSADPLGLDPRGLWVAKHKSPKSYETAEVGQHEADQPPIPCSLWTYYHCPVLFPTPQNTKQGS